HALIAAGAMVAAAVLAAVLPGGTGGRAAALRLWAAPWALALVLAVSVYRDHMVMFRFAGAIADGAATLAIAAAALAGWMLSARLAARYAPAVSHGVLLGVAALLVGGSLVRMATSSPPTWEPPADAVTAAEAGPHDETGLRVLVIGVDGGTWKTLDPLREAGVMPNLDALCKRGVTARLQTDLPTYSPNLWTSIATGKTLDKHGIPTHVYSRPPLGLPDIAQRPDGIAYLTKVMKYAVRRADRRGLFTIGVYGAENLKARRYWDIAGEFGLPSVTLEWYVTHPAEPVLGVEVSDRFHLLEGEALGRAVFPAELAAELESDIVRQADLEEEVLGFADTEGMSPEEIRGLADRHPDIFGTLAHEMARDLTTRNLVGSAFPRIPDWRVGSVYFRAMDGSHHTAWQHKEAAETGSGDAVDALVPVVDRYTAFCDELIAAPLALADSSTVVIMVSDHGWEDARRAHARKPDGFFVMAGGPVTASAQRTDVSVYDVAPTILALLGIPVPEDMDGRALTDLFDPAFRDRHPVRTVPSYEHEDRRRSGADAAADEEFLEQLRALGYVGP
ncbi:MAG TPA: alkaline phosphatase family protein, partial [bacterium]|nr:alkaline phosphatase family protein [bacterium]